MDLTDLPRRIDAAKPDAFVDVVTLRREVYDQIRSEIQDLPGTVFRERAAAAGAHPGLRPGPARHASTWPPSEDLDAKPGK